MGSLRSEPKKLSLGNGTSEKGSWRRWIADVYCVLCAATKPPLAILEGRGEGAVAPPREKRRYGGKNADGVQKRKTEGETFRNSGRA